MTCRSAQFAKLADHPQIGRDRLIREVLPPLGMGDLRDVNIAVRVDGQTMRAHVVAWRDTRKQTANTGQKIALVVDDREPRSKVRIVTICAGRRPQFADVTDWA